MNNIKPLLVALISGTLFGFGLSVAQMIDPAKVIGFMNIAGQWDPSLAFVMGGALLVNIIATPLILKRERPMLADIFRVPAKSEIDAKIVGGGVLFGIGWGLAGYCPGPMLTSLSFANTDLLIIIASYIVATLATKMIIKNLETKQQVKHKLNEACVG
jgi:uncharacterized membrane protein YedE/YeeE